MPIRFRCVYCEQLLGIARRKAGTVVKCPNCAGQVIVPSPEHADDSDAEAPTAAATDKAPAKHMATVPEKTAPAPAPPKSGDLLFERSDFDELLKPVLERQEPAIASKPSRTPRKSAAAPNAFDFGAPAAPAAEAPVPVVPPVTAPVPTVGPSGAVKPRGIFLNPLKLVLLGLVFMAGLAFAFGGGLLLGIYIGKR